MENRYFMQTFLNQQLHNKKLKHNKVKSMLKHIKVKKYNGKPIFRAKSYIVIAILHLYAFRFTNTHKICKDGKLEKGV